MQNFVFVLLRVHKFSVTDRISNFEKRQLVHLTVELPQDPFPKTNYCGPLNSFQFVQVIAWFGEQLRINFLSKILKFFCNCPSEGNY